MQRLSLEKKHSCMSKQRLIAFWYTSKIYISCIQISVNIQPEEYGKDQSYVPFFYPRSGFEAVRKTRETQNKFESFIHNFLFVAISQMIGWFVLVCICTFENISKHNQNYYVYKMCWIIGCTVIKKKKKKLSLFKCALLYSFWPIETIKYTIFQCLMLSLKGQFIIS